MNKAISIKELSHSFGKKTVLSGISFEVEKGEVFGLLGPSGAGKTTLINILTGQLRATGGCTLILGTASQDMTGEHYKQIGIMMDHFGLYERMSCYDNLRFYQMLDGNGKDGIEEMLRGVGLSEAKKTPVMNLSKGMTNRLAFARAILRSPKILFLDEPTSGLDPTTVEAIHKMILEEKQKGTTIFLTTHNMHEAEKLCDNIALLNEGKIVEYGAPATELLDGKTSWTIEEYLDFMEEYPNAFSAEGYAEEVVKGKIFRTAMYLGIEAFIDEETGIATFGSERFRSILKRISALDVSVIPQSREERAKNGEVVLWDLDFFKTENLLSAEQKNGKELTLIGYPGSGLEEGHKSGGLIGYTDLIGIHRATKHVDGAWNYVESYIAGGLKKGDFYFPTGKDAFEEKLQEGIDKQNPEITQVHVEKVRSAFQEGVYLGDEEYDLLSILDEEVIPYFKGDKELDDVVKIIQNRIQLYLDEK